MGSSWNRNPTCNPCIGRWTPNHWTSRKASDMLIFKCLHAYEISSFSLKLKNSSLLICDFSCQSSLKLHIYTSNLRLGIFLQFRRVFSYSLLSCFLLLLLPSSVPFSLLERVIIFILLITRWIPQVSTIFFRYFSFFQTCAQCFEVYLEFPFLEHLLGS